MATRDVDYEDIESGWIRGTVDATWFCVECWKDKLQMDTCDDTRAAIGLPPAAIPADVIDHRFHQHGTRWSICDNCEVYCTGRARDYLPGSFVYATDNTHAGPPKDRRGCFPTLALRGEGWLKGMWNATYLCRSCLVREWGHSAYDIDKWLEMHHQGAHKAASKQWHKSYQWQPEPQRHSRDNQRWYGQWHDAEWGSGWSSGRDRWK